MKRFFYALTVALAFSCAYAEERPSCEDLGYIAETLDYIYVRLDETGAIKEDDEVDTAFGDLITRLENIAIIEENVDLTSAVSELSLAWEEMDVEKFRNALDKVIANFVLIYQRDCE